MRTEARHIQITVLALALALAAATGAAQPGSRPPAAFPALADGAVVDPVRGVAYLSHAKGGIEAVELAGGTTLWTSGAAARPLLAAGDLLLAQAAVDGPGRLALALLDVRRSGAVRAKAEVELPPGVHALLRDEPGLSFRIQVLPLGSPSDSREVLLTWIALEAPLRGAPPAPGPGAAASTDSLDPVVHQGGVRVELATGRAVALAASEAAALRSASWLHRAQVDLGANLKRQMLSADGRHRLDSEQVAEGAPGSFRWTIADPETGKTAGTVELPVAQASFVVAGRALLYVAQPEIGLRDKVWREAPLRLAAVDLASGRELWSRPLVDPAYRGPLPP